MSDHDTQPAARAAAFYDLDGTLLNGTVVDHYLYYARHDPHLPARLRRVASTLAKAPYYVYLDRQDRRRFNQVFYRSYEGLSEDRLAMLGESLFEGVLQKKLYDGVQELLQADRDAGRVQVLLTGALDFVARPVARYLGIETVVASRLEFGKNGLCTGVLRPPVMAGPEKAGWIREFAAAHGIDLGRSVAYADDAADLPMLSMVGRPVAVNPDSQLLATARSHGWPVLHIDAPARTLQGRLARGALGVGAGLARALRDEAEVRAPAVRARLGALAGQVVGALERAASEARVAVQDGAKGGKDT
ncbi:MAG: HAD-IB family hydrolase [Planctomycetes bacterium]|nr:HAD-IB family hydrolase [Planctomycetota bacterium]